MKKNLVYKTVFIIAVLLVFLYGILGVPKSFSKDGLLAAVAQHIKLGLDLRGGTHLILQVMVDDAVNAETDRTMERIREALRTANVAGAEVMKPDPAAEPERVEVRNVPPDQSTIVRNVLSEQFPDYDLASGTQQFTLRMKPQPLADLRDRAIELAIQKIRERVDKLGVSEPVIQRHGLGENQILVQLPGVDDPARVKDIIQSTAMLEIRQAFGGPYANEQEALAANGGVLPPGSMLMRGRTVGSAGSDAVYVISRSSAVAGHDLREARPERNTEEGGWQVSFILTRDGGQRFANFTRAHIGDLLAVVLDNKVMEVATIQSEISDSGRITGRFTEQQVKDLALVLNSGALPASMRYLEERTVGPSLGADSIRQGVTAGIIGIIAVMVFMFLYYRGAGINANLGLVLNLVILLGFMGFAGAVLTLPGIAGVILTIGMGVDSNVLIFERIREELWYNKKTPSQAVEQGFARAWITILDTHVTTMVSALILFLVGTGPVQGFATTLFFGLAANLFTAVFVSRVIFDAILNRKQRGETLSI